MTSEQGDEQHANDCGQLRPVALPDVDKETCASQLVSGSWESAAVASRHSCMAMAEISSISLTNQRVTRSTQMAGSLQLDVHLVHSCGVGHEIRLMVPGVIDDARVHLRGKVTRQCGEAPVVTYVPRTSPQSCEQLDRCPGAKPRQS